MTAANRIDVSREDIDAIVDWAKENPIVHKVWLFGSRVRGDNSTDSDLDIAIEHGVMLGDSDHFTTGLCEQSTWKSQLQDRVSVIVDVWSYRRGETETVEAGINEASVLIYEQAT